MLIQSQTTSLRPQTTAHLAQTMTLLCLTADELQQKIENALATNPALEVIEDRFCPGCHRRLTLNDPCPICSQPNLLLNREPIVFVSPRESFTYTRDTDMDSDGVEDDYTAEHEILPTYVLRQIATELAAEDRLIAVHILTSLDEDGLLAVPLTDIARYHQVLVSRVEEVLHLIQHADPIGVGSRSPQEALLVQLDILAEFQAVPPLATKAIQQGMNFLSRHQYPELAKLLGISTIKAKEIAIFISRNLNPFPARAYWGDIRGGKPMAGDTYHQPDVIIGCLTEDEDSPLVVEVISPLAGKLRVNPLFREAIHQAPPDKAEIWESDLDQATLLVKCIQQRNHTIVRLMQQLCSRQRTFILKGDNYLEPVTRAHLADILEVHESTISRAVANKTAQLPNGRIIPIAKFFDRSLTIRTELMNIISSEAKPLTDTQLAIKLKEKGFPVARRTVAKYRSMEGILPAHLRGKISKRIPARIT